MSAEQPSPASRPEALDLATLLTIDVASELRKVPGAGLEGSWQLPAELVRGAFRGGASRVSVELGRRRLSLSADGDGAPRQVLGHLARLLDDRLAPAARHAALLSLESCHALELAALQSLRPERLSVERPAAGQRLSFRAGAGIRLERHAPRTARGLRLVAHGLRIDRRQARRWLETVCRFVPGIVELNGQELGRGFGESLVTTRLEDPLDGWLCLPRGGETARVWLLQHGVVAAHVTLSGLFCFEAAVEMRSLAPSAATAAALREAITPSIGTLADQALDRLLDLARTVPALPQPDATRVRSLLLACARRRRRTARLLSSAVFPAVSGPPGHRRWLSLLEIGEIGMARGGDRTLRTLHPSQEPRAFVLAKDPVLLLTASERAAVGELLGVRFRSPDPRGTSSSLWTRGRLALARVARGIARWALFPRHGPVLADGDLSRQERRLLELLRPQGHTAEQPPLDVRFCSGGGRVVRVGRRRPRFLLPRANPTVAAAVASAAADPAWAYPAALALLEDAAPGTSARQAWRGRPAGHGASDSGHS